ncbi:MAG TPA: hypothetical protein VFD58_36500 [Blastocatellia bacterium]|nr:hypothetical protein [Blastocatellia bacterium]
MKQPIMAPEIVIREGAEHEGDACAICNQRAFTWQDAGLFLSGTSRIVCRQCGTKHAPGLVSILDDHERAEPRPTKDELLRHYAKSEPRRFSQYDGFTVDAPDILHPDNDGHSVTGGVTWELMGSPFVVRVLVSEGVRDQEIITLLGKIADWIGRDGVLTPADLRPAKLPSVRHADAQQVSGYDPQLIGDDDIPF